jgi:hypothetical protein
MLSNDNPVFNEISRRTIIQKYSGCTFCGCCGSSIGEVNIPHEEQRNIGYTCWLSETKVEESLEAGYDIEVLPLDDGTFLVIKINTVCD